MEGAYYRVDRRLVNGEVKNVLIGVDDRLFSQYLSEHNSAPAIPEGVELIADGAFGRYTFDHISIPGTVSSLSSQMFADTGVKHITYAEYYDLNLDNITPEFTPGASLRLNQIVEGKLDAFRQYLRDHNGKAPDVPEGVRYLGQYSLREIPELRSIYLSDSCTRIGEMSFQNCTGLEEVRVSNKLYYLSKHTFEGCTSLREINLPSTVHCVRTDPFRGCSDDLKINLFGGYKTLTRREFYDSDILGQDKTLMYTPTDRPEYTCLEITDRFIIIDQRTGLIEEVTKQEILDNVPNGGDKIIGNGLGYGDKYYLIKKKCQELGLEDKLPRHGYIILNTPVEYIGNYINNSTRWTKAVLGQIKRLKLREFMSDDSAPISPDHDDCATIYKLAIITGLFENDLKISDKARSFLTTLLLADPKLPNKGLNLDLKQVNKVFGTITNNPQYNREFAVYFLTNRDNLFKLYSKLADPDNTDKSFLHKLYKACGDSNIKYEHDGVWYQSLGRLHDMWEKYKTNNSVKTRNNNDGTNKEVKTLPFLEYALEYGVGGADFGEYPEELAPYVDKFCDYYTNIEPITKIREMMEISAGIVPYAILPEDCPWIKTEKVQIDVSQIGIDKHYIKTYNKVKAKDDFSSYSILVDEVMSELSEVVKKASGTDHFQGSLVKKGTPDFIDYARANCEMGNCSNVAGTGSEGLRDVLLSNRVQALVVKDKDTSRILAQARLMFNPEHHYAYLGSFETQQEVRDEFSSGRQDELFVCFLRTLHSYIDYYNDFNSENKIENVAMGNTAHCTITPTVDKYCPELTTSFKEPTRMSGASAVGIQYWTYGNKTEEDREFWSHRLSGDTSCLYEQKTTIPNPSTQTQAVEFNIN